jgi:hypothetical protein
LEQQCKQRQNLGDKAFQEKTFPEKRFKKKAFQEKAFHDHFCCGIALT